MTPCLKSLETGSLRNALRQDNIILRENNIVRFEGLVRPTFEMSLSREVLFVIAEETEVEQISNLALVCREFKQVCSDKVLWKKIFTNHALHMLTKSRSVRSWVANFNLSFANKNNVDGYMKRLDEFRNVKEAILPINLCNVPNVSCIHVPKVTSKDELDYLVNKAKILTPALDEIFLSLDKMAGEYHLKIAKTNILRETSAVIYVKHKLSKEQVSLLLYRLSRCSLFRKSYTIKQSSDIYSNSTIQKSNHYETHRINYNI